MKNERKMTIAKTIETPRAYLNLNETRREQKERERKLQEDKANLEKAVEERTQQLNKHMQELQERDEIIRKTSTPLVDVWEDVIMIPVIGTLDTYRARQITEDVLERVAQEKTEIIVILSIGGISAIDTKTANHIIRTVHAVKLMGSEMIITGIRPDVATTLVTLGIELTGIVTRSHMREGLEYAFNKLGFKVTRNS